ncbi:hypothetical protein EDB81DRAFT_485910 [Dactylonectria macrodidyma]|uniref:Uncharacterized protein n=1 Tax=Dactylonectria macrodidyma TaxID=307937 RepID=A0A9P9EX38_9HYPO|nr:hypothetical protein EDB81DRAFT_485910 [Dactylonectria macrodidyma]
MAAFALIHAPAEYWAGDVPWEDAEIQATECAMSYCVKTYKPIMINGKLDPRQMPTSYARESDSWRPFIQDPEASGNETMIQQINSDVRNSLAPLHALEHTPGCEYVERSDLKLILIDGDATIPNKVQRSFIITQEAIQATMWGMNQGVVESINNMLGDATNMTAAFDNAARLLTYRIGEIRARKVHGIAEQWVILVKVRWAFLVAPIAMVLGGVLFAANVVIESEMLRLPTLKADPLNAFIYGFDNRSRNQIDNKVMDEEALKKVAIGLRKTKSGIELQSVS